MNRDDKRDNRQKDTGQDAGPKKQGWLRTFGTALNMELREHKSSAIVYLTLRALVIVMMILQLLNRNFENVFLCALTLVLLVMPSLIQVTFKVELPTTLEIIILFFIFAAEILGEISEFYLMFPFWDAVLLILIGIFAGILYCRKPAGGPGASGKLLFSRRLINAFPLRPFLGASALYLICCGIAELLNLALDQYGKINMFYINPDYQMQQVIFRDLIPLLGNTAVILLYIVATILGAFILFLFWRVVSRLFFRR